MPTLDWLNRTSAFSTAAQVPYRLLEQVSVHGNPDAGSDNLLIQGDNLEALKALLPFYRGQVKCIFIDPPYNTRSAFEHYDDNLEHAQWLSMMLPRLQLLRELLREDGSIWVTIDDNEGHYLKVLMDEVFGRGNFVGELVWQKRTSRENRAPISSSHDVLYLYARGGPSLWKRHRNLLPATDTGFSNPDNDKRGVWKSIPFTAQGFRENQMYEIVTPSGALVAPPKGRCWGATEPEYLRLRDIERRVYFPKNGAGRPRIKQFPEQQSGLVPMTLWFAKEVGDNEAAKKESLALFTDREAFGTPKPEGLLARVLHIATNPGDLVLDSFLGSGTTAAVAHKMGRRWIGIEMGEHAATHCLPRLQKVLDGEQGGISKAVGWGPAASGAGTLFADGGAWSGGGFRFMRLGAPVFDATGRIHPDVRFATLAAFVWQQETGVAWPAYAPQPLAGEGASVRMGAALPGTPYLGTHYTFDSSLRLIDVPKEPILLTKKPLFATYLLFNGILGDKRPASGNVLTQAVLDALLSLHAQVHGAAEQNGAAIPLLVFGEACRLGPARLKLANVTFKHIPYDVRAR